MADLARNDIDTALIALAFTGGSPKKASALLADKGIDIDAKTLSRWKNATHADRYAEIQQQHGPEIEQHLIAVSRELAVLYSEGERIAAQATIDAIERGDLKDPSGAMRNFAVARGISTDQMLKLDGRPTEIVVTGDARDLLNEIKQIIRPNLPYDADTTAEDA